MSSSYKDSSLKVFSLNSNEALAEKNRSSNRHKIREMYGNTI